MNKKGGKLFNDNNRFRGRINWIKQITFYYKEIVMGFDVTYVDHNDKEHCVSHTIYLKKDLNRRLSLNKHNRLTRKQRIFLTANTQRQI